jgi:hypothetical protein
LADGTFEGSGAESSKGAQEPVPAGLAESKIFEFSSAKKEPDLPQGVNGSKTETDVDV